MTRDSRNNSQKLGKEGEAIAKNLLMSKGYRIIATNWRYRKFEIDIIAQQHDQMVFVEVKTRKNDTFGEPEEFVSRRQQNFLIAAAHHYLVEHHIELESRFDVIAITENNNKPTVKHLESAFYPKPK